MPGKNCSIIGCGSCRREKYKNVGIFKLPSEKTNKAWRDQWLGEIKKTRTVNKNFLELIKNDRVYTSERHFKNEDIETCK